MSQDYFVYLLECSNGTYYAGYTTDIKRRYSEHCQGTPACKYTRSFPPKKIVACWVLERLKEALSIESQIKRLKRSDKLALVKSKDRLFEFISKPDTIEHAPQFLSVETMEEITKEGACSRNSL